MFSFIHPWLLAGLIGLSIPVLVHFLTRPKPRAIAFPMHRFLTEAASGRQALQRLRTFLVLALRTLAVAALVLLFAGPFLREPGAATSDRPDSRLVIILDSSLSMRAADQGLSLFDRAKQKTIDILKGLRGRDAAGVLLMGASPVPVLPALTNNIAALRNRVEGAMPGYERARPEAALAKAREMLGKKGRIIILSDFQETNWEGVDLTPPPGLSISPMPVGNRALDNLAVTEIRIAPAQPVAGQPIEVSASVLNSSPRPATRQAVLEAAGRASVQTLEIPPFSTANLRFSLTAEAGLHQGRVLLENSDALAEDNARHISLRVRPGFSVLLLGDDPISDFEGATAFVRAALSSEQKGLRCIARHSQDADGAAISGADAIVICPPATLSADVARAVAARVASGASLIVFLDGRGTQGVLSALSAASDGALAPPFSLAAQVRDDPEAGRGFSVSSYAPPLSLFEAGAQCDLNDIRPARHFLTKPAPGSQASVPMRHADGSAALGVCPYKRGTAFFVNIPVRPDGGNLVGTPHFVVLLNEMLQAGDRSTFTDALPGEPWDLALAAPAGEGLRVEAPDGSSLGFTEISLGDRTRLSLDPARMPGVYRVLRGDELLAQGVVNIDPAESDTRILPAPAAAAAAEGVDQGPEPWETGKEKPLWQMAALALIAFLLAETLVLALWPAPRTTLGKD